MERFGIEGYYKNQTGTYSSGHDEKTFAGASLSGQLQIYLSR